MVYKPKVGYDKAHKEDQIKDPLIDSNNKLGENQPMIEGEMVS